QETIADDRPETHHGSGNEDRPFRNSPRQPPPPGPQCCCGRESPCRPRSRPCKASAQVKCCRTGGPPTPWPRPSLDLSYRTRRIGNGTPQEYWLPPAEFHQESAL